VRCNANVICHRKELHVLGTLFIRTRLPCPSAREFASGLVHVHIAIGGREAAIYVAEVLKGAKLREQRLPTMRCVLGQSAVRVGTWVERYNWKG
jgi:hypothetical protein